MTKTFNAAIIAQHTAILGKTGSGKTSTEKLIVEQVVAEHYRVCILDTQKSDWYGIASNRKGTGPGLPFTILGGPRKHVDLRAGDGKAIGQLVGTGKLPLSVLDMADFEPGGVQRFFSDFAQSLMRHMRGVLYLVIEEAHEIAPKERAGFGAENLSIHWAKKLATAGRSKGIRLVVATQRTQSLHNAVLGSCETLIVHRLTAPADQEPIMKWLRANTDKANADKIAQSLSSLPTGTGWICSGEAKIFKPKAMPRITTYDNSATPTLDSTAHDIVTAPVDHDELKRIMGDAYAEAQANDPKALHRQIADLKLQLSTQKKVASSAADIAAAKDTAYAAGMKEGLSQAHKLSQRYQDVATKIARALDKISTTAADTTTELLNLQVINCEPVKPAATPIRLPARTETKPINNANPDQVRDHPHVDIGKGERQTLIFVASQPHGVSREAITVSTGYKRSTRNTYLQRLKTAGLISDTGENITATSAGIAALGNDYEPPLTGSALRDRVLDRLPAGERKILDHLIEQYPEWVYRRAIDNFTGFKRSTRNTYLQRLENRYLITTAGDTVRASENLF